MPWRLSSASTCPAAHGTAHPAYRYRERTRLLWPGMAPSTSQVQLRRSIHFDDVQSGGWDGKRTLSSVETFTPKANQWTLAPIVLSTARECAAAVGVNDDIPCALFHCLQSVVGDVLVLAGGYNETDVLLSSVETINLRLGAVKQGPALAAKTEVSEHYTSCNRILRCVQCAAAVTVGADVLVAGGWDGSQALSSAFLLTDNRMRWAELPAMRAARNRPCVV